MIERNRVVRTIFGIAFTIVFAIFAYISCRVAPHSSDINPDSPTYDMYSYGYDRYNYLLSGRSVIPIQDNVLEQYQAAASDVSEVSVEIDEAEISPPVVEETIADETVDDAVRPEVLRAEEKGLPAPPDIDVSSWEFILANGDNSISEYEPLELSYLEEIPLDSRIIEPMTAMVEDARSQGLNVYLSSGYRSYSDQAQNFIRVCNNNGVSDGKDANGFYITMPAGCSEHQTGLACDITDIYYSIKDSSIANTETYQYMSKHCHEFGFIVRFPEDKQSITGVMYEPFHYRYVGIEAANYMVENNLCLEEFLDLYTPGILKEASSEA